MNEPNKKPDTQSDAIKLALLVIRRESGLPMTATERSDMMKLAQKIAGVNGA